jgi:hypothetical protein
MLATITPEYIKFIKQFLIQRYYFKYLELFLDKEKKEDKEDTIWNELFRLEYPLLQYYLLLLENENRNENVKQSPVYKQETFQEYIDRIINLKTVGPYDYQEFIKNMMYEPFKSNMISKYNRSTLETTQKNHLIYVIKLYITSKIDKNVFMTEEEMGEIDTHLDLIPYFEYTSQIDTKKNNNTNMKRLREREIENEVFNLIDRVLLS